MKDIVAHCDKTIDKKKDNIKDTETHWKNITEREEQKKNPSKTIKKPSKTMMQTPNIFYKKCSKSSIF